VNSPSPPPGWYQDPSGPGLRWWDGTRWTEHEQPAVALPPPPPSVAAPVPGASPPRPVPAVPQGKWWHIPLLVALSVLSTVVWIVVQFLA
jgi:hypothetical protein